MFNKMRKIRRVYLIGCMMTCNIAMTAVADMPPMSGELEIKGVQNSLQSPVFLSFWLIWGGLVVVSLSLFFMRSFLRAMALVGFGILMLIIGFVTGAKNYDYCGKCGTKLERWYFMGHHAACPKCSPEVIEEAKKKTARKYEDFMRPKGFPISKEVEL